MKEILIHTEKNEVAGGSSIEVFGKNAAGIFVARTPTDYYAAAAERNRWQDAEPRRKLRTHRGRSEMLGGEGISTFDGWVIAEVPEEWWEACGNERVPVERQAEMVGGIVRAIRRQMAGADSGDTRVAS